MKNIRKLFAISYVFLIIITCAGCTASQKTFSYSDFSITLTNEFEETESEAATYYLKTKNVAALAIKYTFDSLDGTDINADSSISEYADAVFKANNLKGKNALFSDTGNFKYFDYENTENDQNLYYFATVFKGSDAFWICTFACETSEKDKMYDTFMEWANTITVQ